MVFSCDLRGPSISRGPPKFVMTFVLTLASLDLLSLVSAQVVSLSAGTGTDEGWWPLGCQPPFLSRNLPETWFSDRLFNLRRRGEAIFVSRERNQESRSMDPLRELH
jgi:hypothetical protein